MSIALHFFLKFEKQLNLNTIYHKYDSIHRDKTRVKYQLLSFQQILAFKKIKATNFKRALFTNAEIFSLTDLF